MPVRPLAAVRRLLASVKAALGLVVWITVGILAALLAPFAADAAPLKAPTALTATLKGKSVSVTWKKTSGTVEVAARVTGAPRYKVKGVSGRSGKVKVAVVTGKRSAPAASDVNVRARRCSGPAKSLRCGRWSRTIHPATAKLPGDSTSPAAGISLPVDAASGPVPTIGSCPVFPASNAFNQDVSSLPVDPRSAAYLDSIGTGGLVHPDFGAADLGQGPGGFGIPYRVVPATQPLVPTVFTDYADESDPGPYPVPLDTPVEGGPSSDGDRHVLVVREGECKLYEMGNAYPKGDHWEATGGAVFDLRTGPARPAGWTSADAAGLPILPGLVRYDEVAAGAINHATRFTVSRTQRAYIAPASHWASSSTDQNLPPMGLRLRMRADFDLSKMRGQSLVVATALKRYGMIVADNGSNWYLSGAADTRWDDEDLNQLKRIPGSAFEVVQTGSVIRP